MQEQEFERLGSSKTIHVNVRMIAATHRDLRAMIRDEKFREDLFYRFNVFPIEIPPLRERREDIPLLVKFLRLEVLGTDAKADYVDTKASNGDADELSVERKRSGIGEFYRARRDSYTR